MRKSIVNVKKMDCPSEIKIIESLFEDDEGVRQIAFDLGTRQIIFFHSSAIDEILNKLSSVKLPGILIESEPVSEDDIVESGPSIESQTLKILLAINFGMFVFEIALGLISESTGLIADSIDMLADSLVYGISLYAVGKAANIKSRAAFGSGIFQMVLAFGCVAEVARRFIYGSEPVSWLMIGVSSIALVANVACLFLIHKHKDGEVHMKASWIFSANDVIANAGVILAGILVYFTGSRYPDLIVAILIAIVVFVGAMRILRLARQK